MNLESISPLIISSIVVASRFLLGKIYISLLLRRVAELLPVYAKLLNLDIPRNLDLLIYSLNTCGLRWSYAQRLEKVIRTATSEHKLPVSMTSLPVQFYDLQYSYLDIDEALRVWAAGLEPWAHLDRPDESSVLMPDVVLGAGTNGTLVLDGTQLVQS